MKTEQTVSCWSCRYCDKESVLKGGKWVLTRTGYCLAEKSAVNGENDFYKKVYVNTTYNNCSQFEPCAQIKMEEKRKKLIQLRTKLEFYKKLDKKLKQLLNDELKIEDWSSEVYGKISKLEIELDDLRMEMDLPDTEWGV